MRRPLSSMVQPGVALLFLLVASSAPGAIFTVTTLADENDGGLGLGLGDSLRECFAASQANTEGDTIDFDPALFAGGPQSIQLAAPSGSPLVSFIFTTSDDLEIVGPGADLLTINAKEFGGIFLVETGATFTLQDLTLAEGLGIGLFSSPFTSGAITVDGSAVIATRVAFRDCTTIGYGGAIGVGMAEAGGVLLLDQCELTGNYAVAQGGGVYAFAGSAIGILNSTFSGNSAQSGGGLWLEGALQESYLLFCTFVANEASSLGGGISLSGSMTNLEVGHLLVARNIAPANPDLAESPSPSGFVDLGFNLIGNGDGTSFVDGVNNDQVGTTASPIDPVLGPLGYYGGPTQTYGLLPGSPALDSGAATPVQGVDFDQRGGVRFFGSAHDRGAYEAQDIDEDTVLDVVENAVPSRSGSLIQPTGDGNGDNIIDSSTNMQASLPQAVAPLPITRGLAPADPNYMTLVASANTHFQSVGVSYNPASDPTILDPTEYPYGFVAFEQVVQNPGDPAQVNVFYEEALPSTAVAYFKVGSTPTWTTEHLYRFDYFGSGTGAVLLVPPIKEIIILLRDGAVGDNDLVADGVIRDPGGPGVDDPLYVDLVSLGASAADYGDFAKVTWETAAEVSNVGFNVYRATVDSNGRLVPGPIANTGLIGAEGGETAGATYTFIDPLPLAEGEQRFYVLEDIDASGARTHHGPVPVILGKESSAVRDWMILN